MKAELLKKEGINVSFKITVENDKFKEAVNKAYNKTKGKYNIPGFRKGKAPKVVIETQYGKGIFYNDAIDMLFKEVYPQAIKELNLDVIDRPSLDIEQISEENGLVMLVDVQVKPEFEVGTYKGVEVKKEEVKVSEDEVELELKEMATRGARLVSADKGLESGDTAVIDYEGFDNGVAFEGGKGENYSLVIGSNTFIPGFEDQLIGKKAGEEVEVNVTFPEKYHAPNLAGKPVVFNVKVNDVKVKEIAEINDEFAKDVSEFETLKELKDSIRTKLEEQAKKSVEDKMKNDIISKICDNTEVEIPSAMVEHQLDNLIMQFNYQLQYQGLNLKQLLDMSGKTIDDLKDERREDAKKGVKMTLVLEKIAEVENVQISNEEFDAEISKMASMYNIESDKLKNTLREEEIEGIKEELKIRKVVDLLVENAKLV